MSKPNLVAIPKIDFDTAEQGLNAFHETRIDRLQPLRVAGDVAGEEFQELPQHQFIAFGDFRAREHHFTSRMDDVVDHVAFAELEHTADGFQNRSRVAVSRGVLRGRIVPLPSAFRRRHSPQNLTRAGFAGAATNRNIEAIVQLPPPSSTANRISDRQLHWTFKRKLFSYEIYCNETHSHLY